MTDGSGAARASTADEADTSPVRFCPYCGAPLDVQAFVQEYWTADARRFHVWCDDCGHVFDIEATERVTTHEPAH
ncbi:MAG: hypothetical protein WD794_01360 [Mycobacteriales bacterium]